jgi:hypothetical protein
MLNGQPHGYGASEGVAQDIRLQGSRPLHQSYHVIRQRLQEKLAFDVFSSRVAPELGGQLSSVSGRAPAMSVRTSQSRRLPHADQRLARAVNLIVNPEAVHVRVFPLNHFFPLLSRDNSIARVYIFNHRANVQTCGQPGEVQIRQRWRAGPTYSKTGIQQRAPSADTEKERGTLCCFRLLPLAPAI